MFACNGLNIYIGPISNYITFSGTLMGISNSVATISGMVAPLVTGYLTNIAVSREQELLTALFALYICVSIIDLFGMITHILK